MKVPAISKKNLKVKHMKVSGKNFSSRHLLTGRLAKRLEIFDGEERADAR